MWGWEEKVELEKVMLDYVRWIFRLDFCPPRYIIMRELTMEKMRVGWGIRARRFEQRIKLGGVPTPQGILGRECWEEKENNGWGIEAREVKGGSEDFEELVNKERDLRQWEEGKIRNARYNVRYKTWETINGTPLYLRQKNLKDWKRDEVRALMKLRCGNLEEDNKYWIEERRKCIFYGEGRDNITHYAMECKGIKINFKDLGREDNEILERLWDENLDETKGAMISKLWKERESN
ncbi:hypothetical protein ALC60_02913 [Trachymyrmex zeteki]|uniref:Uncharacterized protein n=1 Tax=Mycetomoellerius zeteki TaxID=64791 RepID=A0A151XCI5_9HYME|nr:hypothetical protein ALC60_02913 [Trachymyrmex zeteki]